MPKFLIPYSYKRGGYIEVEALSLEQAKDKAMEESVGNLHNEFYIAHSFEVDDEFSHEVKE